MHINKANDITPLTAPLSELSFFSEEIYTDVNSMPNFNTYNVELQHENMWNALSMC